MLFSNADGNAGGGTNGSGSGSASSSGSDGIGNALLLMVLHRLTGSDFNVYRRKRKILRRSRKGWKENGKILRISGFFLLLKNNNNAFLKKKKAVFI